MEFGNKMFKVTKLAEAIADKGKKEKCENASSFDLISGSGIWSNC